EAEPGRWIRTRRLNDDRHRVEPTARAGGRPRPVRATGPPWRAVAGSQGTAHADRRMTVWGEYRRGGAAVRLLGVARDRPSRPVRECANRSMAGRRKYSPWW